jgi:peptide chain release factor subunit 3
MNPNAKEFKFNISASSWTPPSAALPVPAPIVEKEAPPAAIVDSNHQQEEQQDEDEDAIDETDPLWLATLQLTLGDREKAMKLLDDPDALMQFPEIRAIMENTAATTEEDWETADHTKTGTVDDTQAEQAAANESAEGTGEGDQEDGQQSSGGGQLKAGATEDQATEAESSSSVILAEEADSREHINLVFIGHVDAGKSTLSGSILYLMGKVDKRTIERFEKEAKDRNRESWFLAFILDTSEEERAKGKTVEVGRAHFETEKMRYTILDAPGHKNYVPNMIQGASQADVGILVISARKGEFETGFEKGGQTREHALLARTLGVQHLVVVVNKMDDPTVEWDKGRYEECVGKLKPYLKQVGYMIKRDIKFIPISGIQGDNILNEVSSAKCPWWREMYTTNTHNTSQPTLLSTLDMLKIEGRHADGPLRVPCLDRYLERGCVVMGKVESGTLRVGDEVVIAPTKKRGRVEEIGINDEGNVRAAKPGENVLIKLGNINVEDIQKGYVLCLPSHICPAVTEIKVQLALVDMLEHRPLFTPGYEAVMHVHTVEIEVNCVELISVIDKGKMVRRPFGRTGQGCIARLVMPMSTCMETYDLSPSLGRLTLRDEGRTIAIGKILEVIQK